MAVKSVSRLAEGQIHWYIPRSTQAVHSRIFKR